MPRIVAGRTTSTIRSREGEQALWRSRRADERKAVSAQSLCGVNHLAALVVAAVGADRVGSPGVLAVGARLDLDQRQRQVRAAPSLLRFGELDLWQCHEVEKFT